MNPYPVTNGTAQPRGARSKVVFENNIPVVVTLEFNPPDEPREGNWGPQYMYFLADNQIGFFDPPIHAEIVALDAHAGDTLAIVKRKAGRANKWEVNRVEGGKVIPNQPEPPPIAPAQPTPQERPMVSQPRTTAPPPIRAGNERECISGNLMAAALKQAIEACELAGFAGTHEDVRALAITIYISVTGGKSK